MSDTPPTNPSQENSQPPTEEIPTEEIPTEEIPVDLAAQAADREGFRFIAIGFAFFFIIIIVCASIVALVMKRMGI